MKKAGREVDPCRLVHVTTRNGYSQKEIVVSR